MKNQYGGFLPSPREEALDERCIPSGCVINLLETKSSELPKRTSAKVPRNVASHSTHRQCTAPLAAALVCLNEGCEGDDVWPAALLLHLLKHLSSLLPLCTCSRVEC
jgi:hypothetical protein